MIDIVGDYVLERMLYPPQLATSTRNSISIAVDHTVITLVQKSQTDLDPLFIPGPRSFN